MDAEESSSDDDDEPVRDEFVRWLRRITAQEMRLSEYPRCNLLFKSNRRVSVWTRGERQRVSSKSEEQFSYETQLMMSWEQFSYDDK